MKKQVSQRDIEKLVAKQIEENTREGLHQQFHSNGKLFREWTIVDGMEHGVSREWDENGTLVLEEPTRRGLVHGIVKQWNSKGQLLGEYKTKMGKGIIREWGEDGSLETETEFFSNNTGQIKIYGDPKKKVHEAFFLNDTPISRKKFYELNPTRKPRRQRTRKVLTRRMRSGSAPNECQAVNRPRG